MTPDPTVPGPPEPPAENEQYVLQLYVTGSTPRSTRAVAKARQICDQNLAGRYSLEVIDIYTHPEASRDAQVVAAPTLLKLQPPPSRRIIGDLSDTERVVAGLNIQARRHAAG